MNKHWDRHYQQHQQRGQLLKQEQEQEHLGLAVVLIRGLRLWHTGLCLA